MQTRLLKDEAVADITPVSAKSAGEVVLVAAGLLAFLHHDIAANSIGAYHLDENIYEVVKVTGAISIWAPLYWDADGDPLGGTAGTGCFTTTSTDNTFAGWAVEAAGASDTTVKLFRWHASTVTVYNQLNAPITDPGNAGAIPVTNSGTVQIVTAGAETRTLAAPTVAGQQLLICMKTDGGDAVITCATTVNSTGNNTITLNDAGDNILLHAIQNGANLRWRVTVNDGCTLATV